MPGCCSQGSSPLLAIAEEHAARVERLEELARQLSEVKAKFAQELSRFDDDGLWKGDFASLAEYTNAKLSLTPGETKEYLRVHRKLVKNDVPMEKVLELGWPKLAVVVGRMTRDNRTERLLDVETKTLFDLRWKYQPGKMRARQKAREAKCYTHMMMWHKAYSRSFRSKPKTLEEIADLPPLSLPYGRNSGASAYISGLLICSPVIYRATKQAQLATGLTGKQANLEYVCLHFLKTFPVAGYAGQGVQAGDWERVQSRLTDTDRVAEPQIIGLEDPWPGERSALETQRLRE